MLLIAIYLCFILVVESYNLNIAYFEENSNNYWNDFIYPYDNLHPNITIHSISTSSFTTTAEYDGLIKSEVENKNTEIILTECSDLLLKSNSPYIINDKVLIICMNDAAVGRCNKHFISGITVIPLILNSIFIIFII